MEPRYFEARWQFRERYARVGTVVSLGGLLDGRNWRGIIGAVFAAVRAVYRGLTVRSKDRSVPPILDNSGLCRLLNVDGVAVSDGRTIGADGRCREAVGSTVDVKTATFTNSIGEASLSAHWMDPAFDPAEAAFYYVRVIEIPKPRWTTHDAAFFDIPLPESVAPTVQDRAYTSPIWYTQ